MTTVWSASASLSLGTIVAPTSANNGLFFKVTTAGTTGSSEPNWASVVGQTVYDNDVRYVSFSSTFADLQSINPSAIIELFQLKLDSALHGASTTYYFHAGSNLDANNKLLLPRKIKHQKLSTITSMRTHTIGCKQRIAFIEQFCLVLFYL